MEYFKIVAGTRKHCGGQHSVPEPEPWYKENCPTETFTHSRLPNAETAILKMKCRRCTSSQLFARRSHSKLLKSRR
jgi:hypothetical protein